MITRSLLLNQVRTALERSRIVLLFGPRQCGKTTLARELIDEESLNYFDLEDPVSLARLDEPITALRSLKGLVVIDEVQRRPELFPILRVLADRKSRHARFLIPGSASGDLLRQTSESLAGRAESLAIGGFTMRELGAQAEVTLWRPAAGFRCHISRPPRPTAAHGVRASSSCARDASAAVAWRVSCRSRWKAWAHSC